MVSIKFNVPVAPLVFDTQRVVDPGNYGFSVKDSAGGNISINGIDIIDTSRFKSADNVLKLFDMYQ